MGQAFALLLGLAFSRLLPHSPQPLQLPPQPPLLLRAPTTLVSDWGWEI